MNNNKITCKFGAIGFICTPSKSNPRMKMVVLNRPPGLVYLTMVNDRDTRHQVLPMSQANRKFEMAVRTETANPYDYEAFFQHLLQQINNGTWLNKLSKKLKIETLRDAFQVFFKQEPDEKFNFETLLSKCLGVKASHLTPQDSYSMQSRATFTARVDGQAPLSSRLRKNATS